MRDHSDPEWNESERFPTRRLSSIGGVTTGWRSSLETTPRKRIGSFLIETLFAAAAFGLMVLLIVWLS
jgi:hypothetical protein